MKISNVRLGYATNSSSVHSIIFNQKIKDRYSGQNFGWDEFSLSSSSAKMLYMAQTLYHNLLPALGKELSYAVVHDILGVEIDAEGYVDHAGLMTLPGSLETKQLSLEFFKELCERYKQPDITIVGGNDNEEHVRFSESIRHAHLIPDDSLPLVCRKDNEWWVLLNTNTGTKIRLSFDDNASPYIKAHSPELVDLKITDKCLQNCDFCYQGSSSDGKHARKEDITDILWCMQMIGVFEIALGGGEPTLHPDFGEILAKAHYSDIIVNFSTRDLMWVNNSEIVKDVKEYVSRFAVSVKNKDEIETAVSRVPKELQEKMVFHYVMGTGNLDEVLKCSPVPVILLGFKKYGRGANFVPVSSDSNWVEMVKHYYRTIGIDTVLANQYRDEVEKNFKHLLVQYDEGKFSMYIDAVNMVAGKCSYCGGYTPISKFFKAQDYLNLFASY